MVICASKGTFIAGLIQWGISLSNLGWIIFLIILLITFNVGYFTHLATKKYLQKEIDKTCEYGVIIASPASFYIFPIIGSLAIFLYLMYEFKEFLIEDFTSLAIFGVLLVFMLIIGLPFKKYRNCTIIKSPNGYFLSNGVMGDRLISASQYKICLERYFSYGYSGYRIIKDNSLYGVIAIPGKSRFFHKKKSANCEAFVNEYKSNYNNCNNQQYVSK